MVRTGPLGLPRRCAARDVVVQPDVRPRKVDDEWGNTALLNAEDPLRQSNVHAAICPAAMATALVEVVVRILSKEESRWSMTLNGG